ncbi:nuclear transport factor 2 family protein [Ferribacterium limneticum]|uniref:nuclear transport factor 2 family protein n=1 Tax=Ferribacterium limneticum TaxID=76259 RepID=UPI001CFC230E|nr:nuclear transport factor 2 family protein [Ferribacterium limneticum]UCV17838.1 nuclear transport factor 2 family protein [Ferribacterium limneticum]
MDSKNTERMFASIDGMRVEEILRYFADDIEFQLGNNESICGKDAVRQGLTKFFSSIKGMRHSFSGIWSQDNVVICQSVAEYARMDEKVVALPCVSIFKYNGSLIIDYRVYIDISPVFA